MITVTKEESMEIRKLFPDTQITKTMRQHSGKKGKRYVPENPDIIDFLKKNRNVDYIEY
jgi:hypothetical protein